MTISRWRICWTGLPSSISSPTCPIRTHTPTLRADSPTDTGNTVWRWTSPPALLEKVPASAREALIGILAQDPRPSYQDDPERVYGMAFGTVDVKFTGATGVLTVTGVEPVGC